MNALVFVVLIGLAAPAAAQSGPGLNFDLATTPESEATADRLQAEAFALFGDREKWGRAARLLERSAQLREDHDPARAKGYSLAAQIYAHSDALDASQRAFEKSAKSAEKIGAIVDAALAYAGAAQIAVRRGDADTANAHIRRAILLSGSPHLGEAERRSLEERLLPETHRS